MANNPGAWRRKMLAHNEAVSAWESAVINFREFRKGPPSLEGEASVSGIRRNALALIKLCDEWEASEAVRAEAEKVREEAERAAWLADAPRREAQAKLDAARRKAEEAARRAEEKIKCERRGGEKDGIRFFRSF